MAEATTTVAVVAILLIWTYGSIVEGLFMRCWTRRSEVNWRSFEIKGMDVNNIPEHDRKRNFEDCWLPKAVRDAYEEWIREEF